MMVVGVMVTLVAMTVGLMTMLVAVLVFVLAMLNSCASGVSVVNIDNGFGAAYQASLINHLGAGTPCAR